MNAQELPPELRSLANLHVNDVEDLATADAARARADFLAALQRQNMKLDKTSIACWESTMHDVQ